ncbi:hypothetical protein BCV70DRAFT_199640 [Testicularia cyperi]|uniref:Uncharacterized protein n=1 Tax=Testicularia cyperi TaxID=1882483 RepID=A0A317XRC7_9BASI|nr:hypothetical protein BCV70DRAFT_199640 [Testicularia cyperi]
MLTRSLFRAGAPLVSRRALTVSARVATEPRLKREGPAAHKGHPGKFDDGRDDPYHEGSKSKQHAMKEGYPNTPVSGKARSEAEMPRGQEGAFADHRGHGNRVDGEHLTGSEEASETRTGARIAQVAKNVFGGGKREFSTSTRRAQNLKPTQKSRTSPAASDKGSVQDHPGYTTADAPIDSRPPSEMPAPSDNAVPSSTVTNASAKAEAVHPGIKVMAEGASQADAGVDAITPEDRSQQTWGSNSRSAQFNPEEGARQPLRDGGSHEGGFKGRDDGKSRT